MSDEKDQGNSPEVQSVMDEAASKHEKYGHPVQDSKPRQVQESTGFIRWYQKGGHLDPQSEEDTPEYLEIHKKLGGGRDELELSDGTVIRRSRAPEDPEQARDLDKAGKPDDLNEEPGAKTGRDAQTPLPERKPNESKPSADAPKPAAQTKSTSASSTPTSPSAKKSTTPAGKTAKE